MASVEDYRAMRMTLIAEVATAYFKLLSLESELAIVRQTLQTREEALNQARIRFEGRHIRDSLSAGRGGIFVDRLAHPRP